MNLRVTVRGIPTVKFISRGTLEKLDGEVRVWVPRGRLMEGSEILYRPALIQRALQIHVAVTAVLATLLLGMGQRDLDLPFIVLVAAIAAFVFTDVFRWVRLNFFITNLVAGGTFLILLVWNMIQLRGTAQMLGIANILVYMQIVCLFQEKDPRTCWVLTLLALLQVVVAAALSQSVVFGILLISYLILAPSTLGLLCIYREIVGEVPPFGSGAVGGAAQDRAGRIEFRSDLRLGHENERQVIRTVRHHVFRVLGVTFLVTLAIFFLAPRPRTHAFRGLARMPVRSVGFSDRVRLGELGRAVENPQEVLRIRFLDPRTGERYPVAGAIYLRGAVLTEYTGGEWSHPAASLPISLWPLQKVSPPNGEGLVRQEITIEPLDRPQLFCVWPIVNIHDNPGVMIDLHKMVLVRSAELLGTRFQYRLMTPAFHEGQQWLVMPTGTRADLDPALRKPPPREGPGAVPTLIALAEEWVHQFRLSRNDPYTMARIFERQLRDSGRFTYSLEAQPRSPRLDPIEDFIAHHPRGHCEYFATALVLMLRSQGIPARLVVGYKTEEWNPLGGFFQVRQLHAHTWVEAYLRPDQIPEDLRLEGPFWAGAAGAWLRLDPTPAAAQPLPKKLFWAMWRWLDWLDFLWRQYVVEMDQSRQEETVYRPISTLAGRIWERAIRSVAEFGRALNPLWVGIVDFARGGLGTAVLLLIGTGTLVALIFRGWVRGEAIRRVLRSVLWGGRRENVGVDSHLATFYRRLEVILARLGLKRLPGQTPREWAKCSEVALQRFDLPSDLICLPSEVVEVYYAVRFGRRTLRPEQEKHLTTRLDKLVRCQRANRLINGIGTFALIKRWRRLSVSHDGEGGSRGWRHNQGSTF